MNRKRPLMNAAGGFVLGEVCVLLPVGLCTGILAVLGARVCCLWRKEKEGGRKGLWWILPLFVIFGMGRMYADQIQVQETERIAAQTAGERLEVEGTLVSVKEGEKSIGLEIKQVVLKKQNEEWYYPPVMVYVAPQEAMTKPLSIGNRIWVLGELERFSKAENPGEFDYEAYCHAIGLEGKVYGENLQVIDQRCSPYFHGMYEIKRKCKEKLEFLCAPQDQGVFQAVVLGDKGALLGEIRELYQKNGIAHVLAVSGLHVSIIGLGIYHLLRKGGLGFLTSGGLAAGLTISYGVLTGGSASVLRAVVMVCFQLLADRKGRTYDMLSAMAAAALLLLFQSPAYLFQSGFQLSFGAVLSIGGATPILAKWLGMENGWSHTLLLSGTLQVATYPIIAYHFFEYPIYGVVLNLLVIPLMSYVLMSGIAGLLLGMAASWMGEMAIGTGHYILALYQWLCTVFQKLPGAIQIVGRPQIWQLGLYGGMWLGMLALAMEGDKKQSHGLPEKSVKIRCLRGGILAVWTAAAFWVLSPVSPSGFQAVFLEVGQGDGICLRTKDTVVLVDGGSSDKKRLGEQILEPFFKSQGISKIDYAIVSHGDQDHISGLTYLLENERGIRISHLILPWLGKGDEACEKLRKLAEPRGVRVHWMKAGDRIQAGELELKCLYAGVEGKSQDRNEQSLMLLAEYGHMEILLTGDMSETGERVWLESGEALESKEEKARILKVAHHGSGHSSSSLFLKEVQPDIAVISCGKENSYGHPSPETLERLKEYGIRCLLTMDGGAVIVRTDGKRRWSCESYLLHRPGIHSIMGTTNGGPKHENLDTRHENQDL